MINSLAIQNDPASVTELNVAYTGNSESMMVLYKRTWKNSPNAAQILHGFST